MIVGTLQGGYSKQVGTILHSNGGTWGRIGGIHYTPNLGRPKNAWSKKKQGLSRVATLNKYYGR